MKLVDEGIFLHRIPYSETSAIVSYFTKEHGFQKFMFPGGRKKGNQLFALNIQQLTFYKRPDSDLGKLTQAESLGIVHEIPFHPLRSALAYFVAEVCQKCLNHTEKDLELYDFINHAIVQLDQLADLSHYPHWFLLQLTPYLGIQPQIETNEPQSFHLSDGVFSADFLKENSISGGEMKFLFDLIQNKPQTVERIVRRKALDALLLYYRLHVEYFGELKSKEVIDELFS
ncbi:MAG: DNA repair protein RecO [Bacteroidetes bacterium]|nr:DNA repair protein RecO [Bacteroidota bacterium]